MRCDKGTNFFEPAKFLQKCLLARICFIRGSLRNNEIEKLKKFWISPKRCTFAATVLATLPAEQRTRAGLLLYYGHAKDVYYIKIMEPSRMAELHYCGAEGTRTLDLRRDRPAF